MERGSLMYEGKAKQVYATDDPSKVVIHFKDDATAFNGVKRATVGDKGRINCAMTVFLFDYVEKKGIRHHMLDQLGPKDLLCENVEIIPVEVIVRNIVAGSFARRYGVEEGTVLERPLVEFFYKSDELDDPLMGDDVPLVMGWAKRWELEFMREQSLMLNAALTEFWQDHQIDLVDMKFEFGRTTDGRVLLADELTADGCRLWEHGTRRSLDKDVFRRDLADLGDTYRELYLRIFGEALN